MTEPTLSRLRPPEAPTERERVSVLVVEDDEHVRKMMVRILMQSGMRVQAAQGGKEALGYLAREEFQAIVSDVMMPDMDGIEFLRAVRAGDLDIPVILVSGCPTPEIAAMALSYGAFQYLAKPFDAKQLDDTIRHAVKLRRLAKAKGAAMELTGTQKIAGDRAGIEAQFRRAIDRLWMAFQPLIHARSRELFAYEALVRSHEPSLQNPAALLDAAERLDALNTLGRAARHLSAVAMKNAPPDVMLFVNLHPSDLTDTRLVDKSTELTRIASRVVLEITERASLSDIPGLRARIGELRTMGFRIALDDLGAGYAGLSTFAQVEPDFVKLDMSLVRGIDQSATRRRVVRSITEMCTDLGMLVVAEGVETEAERDHLVDLGCDFLQGYRFGRPAVPFPQHVW
jgi:EAL domain-containing protein (putative c-di-GMP-specific phosphodiesterase class I)